MNIRIEVYAPEVRHKEFRMKMRMVKREVGREKGKINTKYRKWKFNMLYLKRTKINVTSFIKIYTSALFEFLII